MSTPDKHPQRSAILLSLTAGMLLLIGAAVFPLFLQAQQKALNPNDVTRLPAAANYPAPALTLTDLQGQKVSLADTRGQVVLVNNWATWCPPCQAEMPELQAYYEAHAGDGFTIIAIESGEPADQVSKFVQQYGLTFPIWLDPEGAALDAFQNQDLPSSYVIDRDGTIRLWWAGQINQPTLEAYVTPLLEN